MSILSEIAVPFKSSSLLYMNIFTAATGQEFNLFKFTLFNTALSILLLIFYILLCKYVLRVDMSMLRIVHPFTDMDQPVTLRQKISLASVIILIFSMILPGIFPEVTIINKLGAGGIAALCVVILCIVRVDGAPILEFSRVAKHFNFDVYFLIAIIVPIVSALTSDVTGIKSFMMTKLLHTASSLSPILLVIFLVTAAAILTNFANNMVVGAIFISMANLFIGSTMEIHMPALAIALMFGCSASVFFPAASPVNAICFSQTDIVRFGQEFKVAILATVLLVLAVLLLGYPLASIIF